MTPIAAGDVVHIGPDCSVQFTGSRELRVRVISIDDRPTYPGWIWLTGYVLGPSGDAFEKRELYVQAAGLRVLRTSVVTGPTRQARQRSRT